MKTPDDKTIEQLLAGTIRQPSARFEEALRQIPGRARLVPFPRWPSIVKAVAIAASLILAVSLFLQSGGQFPGDSSPAEPAALQLDEEWIQLLTLAGSLENADSLVDAETRFALDYFAFNR